MIHHIPSKTLGQDPPPPPPKMGGEACAGRTCLVPLWGLGEKIVVFCSPHAPVILSDIAILRQNSDKPGHTGHKRATQ